MAADFVYDSDLDKLILVGSKLPLQSDVWFYDPSANRWERARENESAYLPRGWAGLAYDSQARRVILFGGTVAGHVFDETWAYHPDSGSWTNSEPRGAIPGARWSCAMVYVEPLAKAILFGGVTGDPGDATTHRFLGDTWAYDPALNTWTDLETEGPTPAPRSGHAMVYDPESGKVLLFGAEFLKDGGSSADLWSYDPVANRWTELDPTGELPDCNRIDGMVWDSHAGRALLVGGTGSSEPTSTGYLLRIWAYDPGANSWKELRASGQSPSPRDGPALVYDPATDRLILFGGLVGSDYVFDTWGYAPAP